MKLHEYRLNSEIEPTDEMLHEIMEQVAEDARENTRNARLALEKRFKELCEKISANKNSQGLMHV